MAFDINSLSAEDIEALRGVLGVKSSQEAFRTGQRKKLTDLRAPSTAAGRLYRPHFEWSADDPGGQIIPPFPRCAWDENGVEVLMHSQEEMDNRPKGWSLTPPNVAPLTKQEQMERELAQLSPEDRDWLLAAQKKARLERVQALMDGMSTAEVSQALESSAPQSAKAKKSA